MKFELIDRVVEQGADRIVALKSVSSAEEYLADHFPGFAVLPGVMMLESLVQAARLLIADRAKAAGDRPLILAQVRNIRYGNMVRPGQSLRVEVALRGETKADDGSVLWDFNGIGKVEDSVAVQGRFLLAPLR